MVITAGFLSIVGIFLATMTYVFLRGGAYDSARRSSLKGETNPTD